MKIKKIFYLFIFFSLFIFSSTSFAADPQIIGKLNSAFENIEGWLLKLSTPAAAVAVGTGVFMKNLVLVMKKKLEQEKN